MRKIQAYITDAFMYKFWQHVMVSDTTCWEWLGYRNRENYGGTQLNGVNVMAHRVSYVYLHGEIPDGYIILHSCDNPSCVNPAHLSCGTNQENTQDRVSKGRSRKSVSFYREESDLYPCGHERTEENSRICCPKKLSKACKTCNAESQHKRNKKKNTITQQNQTV